jgi:hypothetical protein
MENQQLVSPSRQRSGTPVGYGQGFLSKSNVITLEHPHILLACLQLIFNLD